MDNEVFCIPMIPDSSRLQKLFSGNKVATEDFLGRINVIDQNVAPNQWKAGLEQYLSYIREYTGNDSRTTESTTKKNAQVFITNAENYASYAAYGYGSIEKVVYSKQYV